MPQLIQCSRPDLWTPPYSGETYWAASPALSDVQAAIALASNGDTVRVPAGSATWGKFTVTKWINIIAAGSTKTIITGGYNAPTDYLITFDPPDTPAGAKFRLSGFGITCSQCGVFDTGVQDTAYSTFFRIDHNYMNRTSGSRTMNFQSTGKGLVDSNQIYGQFYCLSIYGNQELNWLSTTFGPGTANNVFVEDNHFYGNDGYHAGGQGGRYCIRHNTYHFLSTAGGLHPAFDVHGNQSDGNMGAMGAEIYENTILMPGGESCTFVDLRGGECIVFGNKVISTGGVGFQIREAYHDNAVNVPSGDYPVAAPDGMPAHLSDSYFWQNYWNTTLMVPPDIMYISETVDYANPAVSGYRADMAYKGVVPRENVHFWRQVTSFNGSVGVGVGLLSARPSSGLTVGVGYWATDTRTLYRATGATTWEAYYTPYTYPHPERDEDYPLKISSNARYLTAQDDSPFLLVGDAPQSLAVNLSMSDTDFYLANRVSYGINAVWVNLLCGPNTGGRSNLTTYDSISPFTSGTDFATPRETYFARVDLMLQAAAKYGITVFLNPAETIDLLSVALANGVTKCTNYGRYLGNRYKNFNNIIWFFGNDFQNWNNDESNDVIRAISTGIAENAPSHLHTTLLDYYVSNSRDDSRWSAILDINTVYTYYPTYAEMLASYNLTPAMPVILGEADYEYERASAPERQRRQEYWSFLAGGCGHLYGNGYIWPFLSNWKSYLDTTGARELQYCKNLFAGKAWHSLVPDQSHVFLTSGYGTFESNGLDHQSISSNDYATAAITADGNLAIIFIPTARTITLDMTKLSGTVSARWYDPTAGTYVTVSGSPFPNTGSRNFTSSGNHSDGKSDWVLVLELA